jgi:hypothetical protein
MYDRQRDFVSFNNSWKNYFDAPQLEVYGFFNPKDNVWMYEFVDNNELSLRTFNSGAGRLFKMCINPLTDIETVKEVLIEHYPNAEVSMYMNMEDWLDDKERNCHRLYN